jgi:hypothetical protein
MSANIGDLKRIPIYYKATILNKYITFCNFQAILKITKKNIIRLETVEFAVNSTARPAITSELGW